MSSSKIGSFSRINTIRNMRGSATNIKKNQILPESKIQLGKLPPIKIHKKMTLKNFQEDPSPMNKGSLAPNSKIGSNFNRLGSFIAEN